MTERESRNLIGTITLSVIMTLGAVVATTFTIIKQLDEHYVTRDSFTAQMAVMNTKLDDIQRRLARIERR